MKTGDQNQEKKKANEKRSRSSVADMNASIKERPDWFRRFIDVATLAIITAGLWLGLDQAEKLTESIESSNRSNYLSTWSTVTTQGMEIDKVFIDHPEFQKYFFDGAVINPGDENFDKASAISILVLDYTDSVLVLLNYMAKKPTKEPFIEYDTWNRYFDSLFRNSPLLCQALIDNKDVYGRETSKVGLPACEVHKKILRFQQPAGRP